MIQLTPVLNKKELEKLRYYNSAPFSQAYRDNKESELYDIVKTARKNSGLENKKIDENNPDTYKNLVYTKPKENSPLSLFANRFVTSLPGGKAIKIGLDIAQGGEDIKNDATRTSIVANELGKAAAIINKPLTATLEKPGVLYSKPISETAKVGITAYQWGKGMLDDMREDLIENKYVDSKKEKTLGGSLLTQSPTLEGINKNKLAIESRKNKEKNGLNIFQRGMVRTADTREDLLSKTNILFGTTNSLSDYWSINSIEEKRRSVIANASPDKKEELQKFYDDTWGWQMAIDVSTQVAGGFSSSSVLNTVATKIANPKISKVISTLGDVVGKYGMGANEILGATQAVSAIAYYATTGKYLFDGDKEATEAMVNGLFSSVVRGATAKFTKSGADDILDVDADKVIKEITSDEGVTRGFNLMMTELKDKLGNKIQDYAEGQGLVPRIIDGQGTHTVDITIKPEQTKIDKLYNYKSSTKKGFMNNIINKAKESGYRNDNLGKPGFINDFRNIVNVGWRKLYDGYLNTRAEYYVKELGLNSEYVAQLKKLNVFGDLIEQQRAIDRIINSIEDEKVLNQLPIYMLARSRFNQGVYKQTARYNDIAKIQLELNELNNKLINFYGEGDELYELKRNIKIKEAEKNKLEEYNPDFITTLDLGGNKVQFNKAELGDYINKMNAEHPEIKEVARKYAKMNKRVLDRLYEAGVLSLEQLNALSKNPNYIPAKITDEAQQSLGADLITREGDELFKSLSNEGNLELAFTPDSFDNLYNYYSKAFRVARKNEFVKTIVDINKIVGNDITNPLNMNLVGSTKVTFLDKGVKIEAYIPSYMADELVFNKPLDGVIVSAIRKINSVTKLGATGMANPVFTATMVPTEFIQGIVKNAAEGGSIAEGIKLQGKGLANKVLRQFKDDPDITEAISRFISAKGGDFGFLAGDLNQIQEELGGRAGKSLFSKSLNKYSDILSGIDKFTSRAPVMRSNILKQAKLKGFNKSDVEKVIWKHFDKDLGIVNEGKITKELLNMGIDAEHSAFMSRGIFDYFSAGKAFQSLGRYIPYANLAPAGINATIKLLSGKSKYAVGAIAGGYQVLAIHNYMHNFAVYQYSWESDEQYERRKEIASILRGQPEYTKFNVGFPNIGEDGKLYFADLGLKNNSIYGFQYGLTAAVMEGIIGRANKEGMHDFDILGALSKPIQDSTVFISTTGTWKDFGMNIANKLPSLIKRPLEVLFNKDFRYGGDVYTEGMGILDDKNTTNTAKFIANLFNKVGYDVNVKGLDRLITDVNPENFPTIKKIVKLYSDIEEGDLTRDITKDDLNILQEILYSSRKLVDGELNKAYEEDKKYGEGYEKLKFQIKKDMSSIKSESDMGKYLKDKIPEIRALYGNKSKQIEFLRSKVNKRMFEINNSKKDSVIKEMGNTYHANKLYEYVGSKNRDGFNSYIGKLKSLGYSDTKIENIMSELEVIYKLKQK